MLDVAGETAFLKKALAKFGISLNINQAIGQLAGTIRDHKHMQRMVTETEPDFRQSFYDSVRPHLKFIAKPLDVYISDAKQMAEKEQLPILKSDGTFEEFRKSEYVVDAENMLAKAAAARTLKLICSRCTIEQEFYGMEHETPVAVIMKARKKGWMYDPVERNETCPECANA